MAVDLHTHSTASDGSVDPGDLIRMASELGLQALALTDHDTLEGIPPARAAAQGLPMELIPGVELSLEWEKGGMHMVVLWLEPRPGPLQDRLQELQDGRDTRNARIVERLRSLGADITLEEIEEEAGTGSVGRPHIAAVMVRNGYVPDIQTAFDEYIAKGKPAYVGRVRLTPEDGIKLSIASGGVPILAHPHTLGIDNRLEMADVLERLIECGLIGIECHYGTYDHAGRAGMLALARRFGLTPAGGSDFHGTYKEDVLLGTGKMGLSVPDHVLEELRARRP
jgi:predicted metal-dependent phosphoesterase TrpH